MADDIHKKAIQRHIIDDGHLSWAAMMAEVYDDKWSSRLYKEEQRASEVESSVVEQPTLGKTMIGLLRGFVYNIANGIKKTVKTTKENDRQTSDCDDGSDTMLIGLEKIQELRSAVGELEKRGETEEAAAYKKTIDYALKVYNDSISLLEHMGAKMDSSEAVSFAFERAGMYAEASGDFRRAMINYEKMGDFRRSSEMAQNAGNEEQAEVYRNIDAIIGSLVAYIRSGKNIKNIVMMYGYTCSGKSTISDELSKRLGIDKLDTKDIGKISDEAQKSERYKKLTDSARDISSKGSVILDGTFGKKQYRQAVYDMAGVAEPLDIDEIVIIDCRCTNEDEIRRRIEKRGKTNEDICVRERVDRSYDPPTNDQFMGRTPSIFRVDTWLYTMEFVGTQSDFSSKVKVELENILESLKGS